MKFRKKPVIIEAIQLNNNFASIKAVEEFMSGKEVDLVSRMSEDKWDTYMSMLHEHGGRIIHTLEGNHKASWGDWIIKGIQGEFYPCKPDIFEATYELVIDNEPVNQQKEKANDQKRS